jgi:hypothetical protein
VPKSPGVPAEGEADLRKQGFWPPIQVLDLDGDGMPDVAAVVTKGGLYGVLAVHSSAPSIARWVIPMQDRKIVGLAAPKHWPRSLQPLFCFYCDTDPILRWSGKQYEYDLWFSGEKAEMGPATLYARPDPTSAAVYRSADVVCDAKIIQVGGTPDSRWYLVEVRKPRLLRGWVTEEAVGFWYVGRSGCP